MVPMSANHALAAPDLQASVEDSSSRSPTSESDNEGLLARLRLVVGSGQPLYTQLLQQLEDMIVTGELAPGTLLPSERELCERIGVSRITVKRAYAELHQRQLISRHQGLGTLVQNPNRLDPGMDRLKGFTEEMRLLGLHASSRILERKVLRDRSIASIFSQPSDQRLLKLVRVRSGNDVPLSREIAWYDLGVAPALEQAELLGGSVYRTLNETCRVHLTHCEQSVEAVLSTPEENAIFGFSEPAPCLLIKRRTFLNDGRMVEYVEGLFRGDRYTYRLSLKI